MPLFQAWILKAVFTSRPLPLRTVWPVLLVTSALAPSLLSLTGSQTFSVTEVHKFLSIVQHLLFNFISLHPQVSLMRLTAPS
jgi:hypothetical protein